MQHLINLFGRPTLAPLKRLSDMEVEGVLLSLPGVGVKVARCVLLYSLRRDVFPVDTHCWRVTCRLGWVNWTIRRDSPNRKDMD